MVSKKKFGVGSQGDEEFIEYQKSEAAQEVKNVEPAKRIEDDPRFGKKTIEEEMDKKITLQELFVTQDASFWFVSYFISILFLLFAMMGGVSIFGLASTALFPFSIILISTVSVNYLNSVPLIYYFIYPSMELPENEWPFYVVLIWYLVKFMTYCAVWSFSYILGPMGIIYQIINLKRMK